MYVQYRETMESAGGLWYNTDDEDNGYNRLLSRAYPERNVNAAV
jgi:hypothetical protein